MKWIPISERLPEKDGWYLWWDGHYYSDQYYIVGNSGHHYTHWLEITGPDDYCEWKYDDYYGCYDRTCCEEPFYLSNDEPLPKNNIHHCPNCG
ncbi:MAG: hypothetical protein KBG19_07780, partial [Bacteroidales bacterium]|nr:hypothetical protein [Bacteroidales bacterium]